MKTIYTLLFAFLLIVPACNRADNSRARAAGETPEQMKEQRDKYVTSVDAKLKEFDQKFDGLDARANALSKPAKEGFKNAIDGLRDERKVVAKKLDDLKSVSVDSWMTLKGEVDAAIADMEHSYEQVSASHETVPAAAPGKTR